MSGERRAIDALGGKDWSVFGYKPAPKAMWSRRDEEALQGLILFTAVAGEVLTRYRIRVRANNTEAVTA